MQRCNDSMMQQPCLLAPKHCARPLSNGKSQSLLSSLLDGRCTLSGALCIRLECAARAIETYKDRLLAHCKTVRQFNTLQSHFYLHTNPPCSEFSRGGFLEILDSREDILHATFFSTRLKNSQAHQTSEYKFCGSFCPRASRG